MIAVVTAFVASHPEIVALVVAAALPHVRAIIPTGKPGTLAGFGTSLFDRIVGNYGYASNKVEDLQDVAGKSPV